jgi:hypothetical protein
VSVGSTVGSLPIRPLTASGGGAGTASAAVEPLFARQQQRLKLTVPGIDLERAQATIGMPDSADNLGRWRWWPSRTASP